MFLVAAGPIPTSLGNFSELQSLGLSSNQLSGKFALSEAATTKENKLSSVPPTPVGRVNCSLRTQLGAPKHDEASPSPRVQQEDQWQIKKAVGAVEFVATAPCTP